jgi:hypothetical protein
LSAHLPSGRYSDSTVPGGEFNRVSQQIQKHLLKPRRIRRDPRRRIMKFGFQMNAFFIHLRTAALADLTHGFIEIDRSDVQFRLATDDAT